MRNLGPGSDGLPLRIFRLWAVKPPFGSKRALPGDRVPLSRAQRHRHGSRQEKRLSTGAVKKYSRERDRPSCVGAKNEAKVRFCEWWKKYIQIARHRRRN
ncbi:protein of unknown function [Caballeronia sp. S22]